MSLREVNTNELNEILGELRAGEKILLTGTVYTARDAAHKRFFELLDRGEKLPIDIEGASIYYAGPTPAKDRAVGACGPTTSSRMDPYSPRLLDMGLSCMIGKGPRSKDVCDSICKNKAIYMCAVGGAGALASKHITSCEVLAFDDLGCESVKKLGFDKFPLVVAIDMFGGNLFDVKGSK